MQSVAWMGGHRSSGKLNIRICWMMRHTSGEYNNSNKINDLNMFSKSQWTEKIYEHVISHIKCLTSAIFLKFIGRSNHSVNSNPSIFFLLSAASIATGSLHSSGAGKGHRGVQGPPEAPKSLEPKLEQGEDGIFNWGTALRPPFKLPCFLFSSSRLVTVYSMGRI